ncbi:MAG: hypothetical protein AAFV53_43680 [Myxococcota bacterium]
MGKMCFEEAIPWLQNTFNARVGRDPLLLPDLVFELDWLFGIYGLPSREEQYLGAMVDSGRFTRWVAAAMLTERFTDKNRETQWVETLRDHLRDDVCRWVRWEAGKEESGILLNFDTVQICFPRPDMVDYQNPQLDAFRESLNNEMRNSGLSVGVILEKGLRWH